MNSIGKVIQSFRTSRNKRAWTMLLILIGMVLASMIISPAFRTPRNLFNILGQNAVYGVMALGMACIILTGSIDLGAGATAALAGVIAVPLFRDYGFIAGVAGGLGIGALIGLVNGLLITKMKINYFITTLGMMSVARGIVFIITNGIPIQGVPPAYNVVGMGKIGMFPVAAIIWLTLAVIMALILRFTRFGRYIYALGGNENAAWLSGVNKDFVKTAAYVICGLFCALGGLILCMRVLMATADAATSYELTVIASCIIGGIAIDGGHGSILSSVVGALIMGLVMNMLQLMGVSTYWQSAVTGVIIIGAVAIDSFSSGKK